MEQGKKLQLNKLLNFYIGIGAVLWVFAAALIIIPIFPGLIYRFFPSATDNEISSLTDNLDKDYSSFEDVREDYVQPEPEPDPLPPFDSTLSAVNTLKIDKIGVNSEIYTGEDSTSSLEKGPWMVNDFGTPPENATTTVPIIIASHRWGILGWSADERITKSFFDLPNTVVGDRVTIVWEQREYTYEIYKAEENTQITDYEADLILYTCKLIWESPDRIFRYANLVDTWSDL